MKKAIIPALAVMMVIAACHNSKVERYTREAQETTAQCPMALDAYTTLDSMTYAEKGNQFNYYYSIAEISDSLILAQKDEINRQTLQHLINLPEMRPFLEDEVTFKYIYRSKAAGREIMTLQFTPQAYKDLIQ